MAVKTSREVRVTSLLLIVNGSLLVYILSGWSAAAGFAAGVLVTAAVL